MVEAPAIPYLAWDAFLDAQAELERVRPEDHERWLRQKRKGIDAFREFEWPAIKAALAKDFKITVTEEPHWTDGGAAVFWCREVIKTPQVVGTAKDGRSIRELVDVDHGWKPTSPQPANNASVIANTLRKGFRLRPPVDGMDEATLAGMVPSAATLPPAPPQPSRTFLCERHGAGERRVFPTWKSYIQHCTNDGEMPEEDPPADEAAFAKRYAYFCRQHWKGFQSRRLAERHIKDELSRPGRAVHLRLDQMQTKRRGD